MRLLITGAWRDAVYYGKEIIGMGHKVLFHNREEDALPCCPKWPQAVICNGLFQYHDPDSMTELQYIQLTSAGLDRVPLEKIRKRGILLSSAAGLYSIPMAEAALTGVLQLYRQAEYFYENQHRHIWYKNRDMTELWGKNVCIVGCGHVGKACAVRFHGMGCHVTGISMRKKKEQESELPDQMMQDGQSLEKNCQRNLPEGFTEVVSAGKLNSLLKDTDILILTVSLTEDTVHLIGKQQLELMKEGAILVNISRGAVIDQEALEHALDHHLGGAVLDVFEEEPLAKGCRLWDMKQVILTPHSSYISRESRQRLNQMIVDNLRLWSKLQGSLNR